MKFSLGGEIRLVRLCGGNETPEKFMYSIYGDGCLERLLWSAGVDRYSQKPTLIVFSRAFLILLVAGYGRLSKIIEAVISAIAVYVVYIQFRPRSRDKEPSESMRQIHAIVDPYLQMTISRRRSPQYLSSGAIGATRFPSKNASIKIVIYKFAQAFRSKLWFSHEASSPLIGERLAAISRRCGPRYCSVYREK
jgi:hypothetical protein